MRGLGHSQSEKSDEKYLKRSPGWPLSPRKKISRDRIEAIPYEIVRERATYRESIYRERAVASERVRLAMGMSLRPENPGGSYYSGHGGQQY